MKSEHRHELQQNELKKIGAQISGALKSEWLDKYSNHILIAISVVCLGLAGWIYWSRTTSGSELRAWHSISNAEVAADYDVIKTELAHTSAAPWAALKAAELRLSDGVRKMFTDRENAQADLDEARTALESLVKSQRPEIRERAMYLLAQCHETEGHLDQAISQYDALIKEFPETVHKPDAERRIASLKSDSTKAFYAWFAKQNPKPDEPPKPKDQSGDLSGPLLKIPELNEDPLPAPKATDKPEATEEIKPEKKTDEGPALKAPPASDTKEEPKPGDAPAKP